MKVVLPALLAKAETMTDGGLKLIFYTRELGDVAPIFQDVHKEVWLVTSSKPDITETDIPDEKPDSMTGRKTQAQRLRAVMYKIWESTAKKITFEEFYNITMEKIIEQLKERLD